MPTEYENHLPSRLSREQEDARRARVVPVDVPGDAFATLVAERVRMIFVVLPSGALVAAPRRRRGENISHAVLAAGGPVLAAGEFQMDFGGTTMEVSELDNMSGHYRPSSDALAIARTAFEAAGISVRPGAVTPYDWEAP